MHRSVRQQLNDQELVFPSLRESQVDIPTFNNPGQGRTAGVGEGAAAVAQHWGKACIPPDAQHREGSSLVTSVAERKEKL